MDKKNRKRNSQLFQQTCDIRIKTEKKSKTESYEKGKLGNVKIGDEAREERARKPFMSH